MSAESKSKIDSQVKEAMQYKLRTLAGFAKLLDELAGREKVQAFLDHADNKSGLTVEDYLAQMEKDIIKFRDTCFQLSALMQKTLAKGKSIRSIPSTLDDKLFTLYNSIHASANAVEDLVDHGGKNLGFDDRLVVPKPKKKRRTLMRKASFKGRKGAKAKYSA